MNVIIAIVLVITAVFLFLANRRGWIKNDTLQQWDQIASVVALILALLALIFPSFLSQPETVLPIQASSLELNKAVTGTVAKGEYDYFTLSLPTSGILLVHFSRVNGGDVMLEILDGKGNVLERLDDQSYTASDFAIEPNTQYFVRISTKGSAASYSLEFQS